MSFRSALRKFKPGQATHIRRAWIAYVLIAFMGIAGIVLLIMLRGAH